MGRASRSLRCAPRPFPSVHWALSPCAALRALFLLCTGRYTRPIPSVHWALIRVHFWRLCRHQDFLRLECSIMSRAYGWDLYYVPQNEAQFKGIA